MHRIQFLSIALAAFVPCAPLASAQSADPDSSVRDAAEPGATDWPMWGGDESRNMVSAARNLPVEFELGDFLGTSDDIDPATTRNVKWIAKLGTQTYGNPTIANGRVYVGTNNDSPRDPRLREDRSIVYCFDAKDGSRLWELSVPKLGTGQVSDWEYVGICSSPTIDGDRVYLVTNRCEVICLDAKGLADGNDGPFTDEGRYMAAGKLGGEPGEPIELLGHEADILWVCDMIATVGSAPHNITTSSVLVAGDTLWVSTSNGIDYDHREIPAPDAPSLIALDKRSGEIVGVERSGISARILHSNWTSPAYLRHEGRELCIFPGPDGFCYAFEAEPLPAEDGFATLKLAWSVDCNPADYREKDGKVLRYTDRYGPSEVIATPVCHGGRVYVPIGQDPEHGEGAGNLVCIDQNGKILWSYSKINRSMSTCAVTDGLVFTADYSGFVYCLDAHTGAEHWVHDTKGHIWSSPLVADGKLFVGNEDGYLTILDAGPSYDKKKMIELDIISPLYSSLIAAGDTLYLGNNTHLYAIAKLEGQ